MSRTWKDAPYKVRQKRLMEKGIYDHDHELVSYDRDRTFVYEDEVEFDKSDAKTIYHFRKQLITDKKDFTEREEPAKMGYRINDGSYEYCLITPKKIIFTITRTVHRKARFSDYCTDAQHFDVNTGNDTRDGKTARCAPFAFYNGRKSGCGCSYCTFDEGYVAKIYRKAKMNKIAKTYNNGAELEDLFDFDE